MSPYQSDAEKIYEQEKQIQELQAQVERLRNLVSNSNVISYENETLNYYEVDCSEVDSLFEEAPIKALNEIKATAVEEAKKNAILVCQSNDEVSVAIFDKTVDQFDRQLDLYSQQLREGK
jgi:TolA-binding protein